MLLSLSLIFLVGLSLAAIGEKLHLPRIVGMIGAGILLGPYVLDLLDPQILGVSAELRKMALIIILIKAGLSLDLSDLKKVGRPAVLMSFVPASAEILGYVLLAPLLLGISRSEAAIMGTALAAVSPAVIVPRMLRLMEEGRGTEKGIPQLIMAGASCDDIFVIVLFASFVGMAQGGNARLLDFLDIPISIVLGIAAGVACGLVLALFFAQAHAHGHPIRSSSKTLVILSVSFLLVTAETWIEPWIAISGLLAVIGMACVIKSKSDDGAAKRLSENFGKLWIAAEVLLFVLLGAAVDIRYTLSAGVMAVGMIVIALAFLAVGVAVCLVGTPLNASGGKNSSVLR